MPRCLTCFRPADLCFCESIPSIDNQTEVLIVQHRREQFHAFNTARIVQHALRRSRLLVDHTPRLAARLSATPLSSRAALLYPGNDARLLADLPHWKRPDQLVILDGTWSLAKTLIRDLPGLQSLPRVRLAPDSPSRYRIRREPNAQALSSLEATVAALSLLEPETFGLERLLDAFVRMIDNQIERSKLVDGTHPKGDSNWRQRRRRSPVSNVPRPLSADLSGVVVAYGEQQRGGRPLENADSRSSQLPLYWVAQRLPEGETFRCAIKSDAILDDDFLACLRLAPEDFLQAVSVDRFRALWRAFLRPDDRVAVYHSNTAKLLRNVDAEFVPAVILKSIKLDPPCNRGTLDDVLRSLGIEPEPQGGSRTADRLASAIALVRYVNSLCRDVSPDS